MHARPRHLLPITLALLSACSRAPAPVPAPAAHAAPTATPALRAMPAPPPVPAPAPANDWLLPGELGPMTTEAELAARYGKDNLREETLPGAEAEPIPALVLFPDDAGKRLELVLDAQDKDAPIQELRIRGAGNQWHTADGLHPGMTLAELVERNGAPITFYGFDWDYGGTVQDWHGGKLANPQGARLFRRVRLAVREGAGDIARPLGDAGYRSDDPRWPGLDKNLVIDELGISWPGEGD